MDKQLNILLGKYKNIKSVNVDNFDLIQLLNRTSEFHDNFIFDRVNSADVSYDEREKYSIYRIYGRIEYLSLLNGLINLYENCSDFFVKRNENSDDSLYHNFLMSFKFFLVKPAKIEYSKINENNDLCEYVRKFEVIAKPEDFDIFSAGFSKNIFNERIFAFHLKKDIDVINQYDYFNFPITELYLVPIYVPKLNGDKIMEKYSATTYNVNGQQQKIKITGIPNLNYGDIFSVTENNINICDIVKYNKNEYLQYQDSNNDLYCYINTPCKYNNMNINLIWKYRFFIPIKLRYLSNELYVVNKDTTIYDDIGSVPEHAAYLEDSNNYIWREILPQEYIDPLTGIGVNYPFINGKRYLFKSIVFSVVPDLSDNTTKNMFDKIWFTRNNTTVNFGFKDKNELNDITKPCK